MFHIKTVIFTIEEVIAIEPGGEGHRSNVRPLLHKRANGEPEAICQAKHVLHFFWFLNAWVWVVPLVRRQASKHKHHQGDEDVAEYGVRPNLIRKGGQEGQ